MPPEDCSRWEGCGAPLCPLEEGNTEYIWYIGEDCCRSAKFNELKWVTNQKLLSKYPEGRDDERAYTIAVLKRMRVKRPDKR